MNLLDKNYTENWQQFYIVNFHRLLLLAAALFSAYSYFIYFTDMKLIHFCLEKISHVITKYLISRVFFKCDVLPDLVPFVQFKKREKHTWRSVFF